MLAAVTLFIGFALVSSSPTPRTGASSTRAAMTSAQETCRRSGGSSSNSHEQRDGELIRWRAHWSGDDCSIDLRSTGDLRFNSDFTDIVSISSGGTFEITETQGSTARRLTIRSEGGGRTSRTFAVNGQQRPWDSDAARWFADLLIELDRMTAVGVDYRYPALYGRGGASAVIAEAEKMYGDYARSVYLRRLVDSASLSNAEYER